MKKSLIALAALAAVSAASAQSTVSLYGRLDASVAVSSTETSSVAKLSKTGVNSSNLNTQFWGLKGSEDLGGGLKANFKLESQFAIDTGAANTNLFDREAYVGVSGGFGEVRLGRNYTAYDNLAAGLNHTSNSNINVTSAVAATGIAHYVNRVNNSIHYSSPTFSGVSGTASYAFGEDKTAALSATSNTSVQARYVQGPLMVGAAYQDLTSQTVNLDIKHNLFGASYDLGVVKLTGSYQTAKQNATKDNEYQVGVTVPMGALTLSAGYADSESKTGAATLDGDGFALVAIYSLSKRTALYAGYESTKVDTSASSQTKVTNTAFGVRHTF
jgi:predicted porin